MICDHVTKSGNKCKHPVLKNSTKCYLKSHHSSTGEYKRIINNLKREWINETYPVNLFSKFNVPDDGWCFFTSFGNVILHKFKKNDANETIKSFFEQEDFKQYISKKDYENSVFLRLLSYKVYQIARSWLKNNINSLHSETKEPICDFIINMNDVDTIDEYFSEESKNIKLDEDLSEEFWGGVCEQYALSHYFDVDVVIFVPSRHSFSKEDKKYKIMLSKVVRKNTTRYKLSSCCYNESSRKKSVIMSFLRSLSDQDGNLSDFFQLLPSDVKKKIINDLRDTVFLLLFIIDDDGDNLSHYNYLIFDDNII